MEFVVDELVDLNHLVKEKKMKNTLMRLMIEPLFEGVGNVLRQLHVK